MTRSANGSIAIPASAEDIVAAAGKLGMTIPQACLPGVAANLALLGRHAELFFATGDKGSAAGT